MDLTPEEKQAIDYLKERFGSRLQAIIASKDKTSVFPIVVPRDARENRSLERREERISENIHIAPFEQFETHTPATAASDFVSSWGAIHRDWEILCDKGLWKETFQIGKGAF